MNDAAAIAACAVIAAIASAADSSTPLTGTWRLNNWTSSSGRVRLELTHATLTSRTTESREYPLDDLRGLNSDQLRSLHASVRFELARDAGVFLCEGSVTAGLGAGVFQFAPSQAFASEMRRMGYGDLGPDMLFSMAMNNVDMVFVRAVQKTGLRTDSARDLIRLRVHSITPEYIAEVRSAGYDYSVEDLVRLKVHGVGPDLLRELKKHAYNLSAEDVVKLRIHGVDPDYIRGLGAAGRQFGTEDIVSFKIHGVDPEFVRELRAAGYDLEPSAIVNLRIQGVTSGYARDVRRAGYDLSPQDIVRLRQNGVAPEFLAELRAAGYDAVAPNDVIRMWQNGVRGEYIARVHNAFGEGARNLKPDQIIKLKVNGVD
jgi:hypothetical protein